MIKTRSEEQVYDFHGQTLEDPACFKIAYDCCKCGEWIAERDDMFGFDLEPDAYFCSEECMMGYLPLWKQEFADKLIDATEEELKQINL